MRAPSWLSFSSAFLIFAFSAFSSLPHLTLRRFSCFAVNFRLLRGGRDGRDQRPVSGAVSPSTLRRHSAAAAQRVARAGTPRAGVGAQQLRLEPLGGRAAAEHRRSIRGVGVRASLGEAALRLPLTALCERERHDESVVANFRYRYRNLQYRHL